MNELETKINQLNNEIAQDINNLNNRLINNPIGLKAFNQIMAAIGISNFSSPYEKACTFYKDFNNVFDYAQKLKTEHPEYSEKEFKEELEKLCLNDEAIKKSIINNNNLLKVNVYSFNVILDIYNTLDYLGFNKIITKQQILEELMATKEIMEAKEEINHDNQIDIGAYTRKLINKGACGLIKLATIIKEKTDK